MTHVMVDLETLSTAPNARIIAIGAVKFEPGEGVYDNYYQAIKTPRLEDLDQIDWIDDDGFHVSKASLQWWKEQTDRAQMVFIDPNAIPIADALDSFTKWVTSEEPADKIRLWGNGASFDNVILASAYRLCNKEQPWRFWNDRCYRTVKNMYPMIPTQRLGTHHNALDDAATQATHLVATGANIG